MSQSVNPTIHLVKAMDKPADQQWIVALVEHEHGVRYEVGNLQKPGFLDACEIWDIREISQDSPARAELPKLVNPTLCALIESALREYNQTPLISILEKSIKTRQYLFRRLQYSIFSVKRCALFDGRGKKYHAGFIRRRNGLSYIAEKLRALIFRNATPESLAGPNRRSVKLNRRKPGKVFSLDVLQTPREEIRDALKNSGAPEHKKPVRRIGFISGFVKVEEIH
jgi:hypothetical protein